MIHFVKPNIRSTKLYVALSGGVDSVVLLHLLLYRKCEVECLFFHHGTANSEKAMTFVQELCANLHVVLHIGYLTGEKPAKESWEEFWRNQRYTFLDSFTDKPICLGHHADDVLETWVWSCAHGTPKLINYSRNKCIRPLLLTTKEELYEYANKRNIKWVEDESNLDTKFARNKIRAEVIPMMRLINPSLRNTLIKKVRNKHLEE